MIESEAQRIRLTELITRWCDNHIAHQLKAEDIPGLVNMILGEFFPVHLTCGHIVRSGGEGVCLTLKEHESGDEYSTITGFYCADCARTLR